MGCYLDNNIKQDCVACEACAQICAHNAISFQEDKEAFRYPVIDTDKCVDCGLCRKVCPIENMPERFSDGKAAFGGYIKDLQIREESTSGGAFSAIVDNWCQSDYVIFGAETRGLEVFHSYIEDKKELYRFRKSKYTQSHIGSSYKEVKKFLKEGKSVVFSGTPCQIAGLKSFLGGLNQKNLLTIEVICEGVPTPHYIHRLDEYIQKKEGYSLESIDYRYKDVAKWDFEVMKLFLKSTSKTLKRDRWFNPFWSIWLNHLMSRPSCYCCRFANTSRTADISLGDLWGVHLYCPELYGKNRGASLIVCNTEKGKHALDLARKSLYGHDLKFEDALKYQSPMRKTISNNERRSQFMKDVAMLPYEGLVSKWAVKPSCKLLYQKYIWGNRQKVAFWNLKQRIKNLFKI